MAESAILTNRTLLWSNPNPNTAFAAQTVINNTNLSKFDRFEILIKANINEGLANSIVLSKNAGTRNTMLESVPPTSNDTWTARRRIEISDTAISFGNGGYIYWGGGGQDLNNNTYGIPLKIYGIRGNIN